MGKGKGPLHVWERAPGKASVLGGYVTAYTCAHTSPAMWRGPYIGPWVNT
jgi:hypothetical protein